MLTTRSKYYLLVVFLLGAIASMMDSAFPNPGFLIGSGVGFLVISFLIGITLHSILLFLNFYKKKQNDTNILDENLNVSEKEEWKRQKEIREKPYQYTLYVSILLFILMLLGCKTFQKQKKWI
jgi:polyferredoxin